VQVRIEGQPVGSYVVAYGVDLERAQLVDFTRTYAGAALGSLLLVALVGWLVAGRVLRPLRLLRDGAERIAETDLLQRASVRGDDDVSDLSRSFNAMLDRALDEPVQHDLGDGRAVCLGDGAEDRVGDRLLRPGKLSSAVYPDLGNHPGPTVVLGEGASDEPDRVVWRPHCGELAGAVRGSYGRPVLAVGADLEQV